RHTRSYGDWSSDVCSSDLRPLWPPATSAPERGGCDQATVGEGQCSCGDGYLTAVPSARWQAAKGAESAAHNAAAVNDRESPGLRSEERRVGKECKSWGALC